MATLTSIPRPEIPLPEAPDELTLDEYEERRRSAQRLFDSHAIDFLVVYGDRETFGDLCFLTGTDPRFEEAVYLLPVEGPGSILLGNENLDQGPASQLGIEIMLYQALSPAGQIRTSPAQLVALLTDAGLEPGSRIGVAGGKRLTTGFVSDPESAVAAPAYLVDALRSVAGSDGSVVNAEGIFTDPEHGLRMTSSAHQIALFEYGAAIASASVMNALGKIEPGIAANILADTLFDRGIPHTCHSMINFGPRQGLYSPSSNPAGLGDAFTIAQGLRGGLTCRAGAVARGPEDLSRDAKRVFPDLVLNYFDAVCAWHEAVAVGRTAGSVYSAVDSVRTEFSFSLNPGHFLHLEEWLQSTFEPENPTVLRSGSMLQCDVIPVVGVPNVYINIEDGVVLADESLRTELADGYPELWDRVQRRRNYLGEVIGVELDKSVLPMSSMPLWHAPFALDREQALTR